MILLQNLMNKIYLQIISFVRSNVEILRIKVGLNRSLIIRTIYALYSFLLKKVTVYLNDGHLGLLQLKKCCSFSI